MLWPDMGSEHDFGVRFALAELGDVKTVGTHDNPVGTQQTLSFRTLVPWAKDESLES